MQTQNIHIKNMCCQRCIEAVQEEFLKLGLKIKTIRLGEAVIENAEKINRNVINEALKHRGFELIISENEKIVEAVKTKLIAFIHHPSSIETELKISLSIYLEEKLRKPYRQIQSIFSKQTKHTIEKYTILLRIERVKELIDEDELNFSEIAHDMGYKTLQHLSGQFKKCVGMSMAEYKNSENKIRKPIDEI